jgi:hypothetical protein
MIFLGLPVGRYEAKKKAQRRHLEIQTSGSEKKKREREVEDELHSGQLVSKRTIIDV